MHGYEFYVDPPRCIACSNCVLACPFGIPTVHHPVIDIDVEDYMEKSADGSEAWLVDDAGLG